MLWECLAGVRDRAPPDTVFDVCSNKTVQLYRYENDDAIQFRVERDLDRRQAQDALEATGPRPARRYSKRWSVRNRVLGLARLDF